MARIYGSPCRSSWAILGEDAQKMKWPCKYRPSPVQMSPKTCGGQHMRGIAGADADGNMRWPELAHVEPFRAVVRNDAMARKCVTLLVQHYEKMRWPALVRVLLRKGLTKYGDFYFKEINLKKKNEGWKKKIRGSRKKKNPGKNKSQRYYFSRVDFFHFGKRLADCNIIYISCRQKY